MEPDRRREAAGEEAAWADRKWPDQADSVFARLAGQQHHTQLGSHVVS